MATILNPDQAKLAYEGLTAAFIIRWPYRPGRTRDDQGSKIGYILALEDMAMIAFGISRDEAHERVAEDYADYVASLG